MKKNKPLSAYKYYINIVVPHPGALRCMATVFG
jgi:hypothetical protein